MKPNPFNDDAEAACRMCGEPTGKPFVDPDANWPYTVVRSPAAYEAMMRSKRMKRPFVWLLILRVIICDHRTPIGWLRCWLNRLAHDLAGDAAAARYAANRGDPANRMLGPAWLERLPPRCAWYCQWATGRAFPWLERHVPGLLRQRFQRHDD